MKSMLTPTLLLIALMGATQAEAQAENPGATFRRGNEAASQRRWDSALDEYSRLAKGGVRAPSLYWNWGQVAAAGGRKGEALWAMNQARELAPRDPGVYRELERLRIDLGLDPSEVSLGPIGDVRAVARRFRFDAIAAVAFLLSALAALGKKPRIALSRAAFLAGLLLLVPLLAGRWQESRGVVIHKDAPLVDAPRVDALALANLREGEIVPLLGEDGEYLRIQDASGARGFAHRDDVWNVEAAHP